jgi:hypothetical protein
MVWHRSLVRLGIERYDVAPALKKVSLLDSAIGFCFLTSLLLSYLRDLDVEKVLQN